MKCKVCMLGSSAVGKTSLVQRYVRGIFSERYLTTMGAKIDKKSVLVDEKMVDMVLWDLNGEDRYQEIHLDYVRGAAGYLLVIDRTRKNTLEAAHTLQQKVRNTVGDIPFVTLFNKSDLEEPWEDFEHDVRAIEEKGWSVVHTSAKLGTGVDEAFLFLARKLIQNQQT